MTITNCTLDDFAQIFTDIADFWGHDRTLYLHHPMYIREFGNTASTATSSCGGLAGALVCKAACGSWAGVGTGHSIRD